MTEEQISAALIEAAKLADAVVALAEAVAGAAYVDPVKITRAYIDARRIAGELRRLSGERP